MLLHEAVKKARRDLNLSQKKLAELAGIQRRQLATLESGGNITLATLRKVLAHLPNLETFTLDTVTATVRREVSAEEQQKAVDAAMRLLSAGLKSLVAALQDGRLPDSEAMRDLKEANNVLYQGLGYSVEDVERERRARAAIQELDAEQAVDAVASLIDRAQWDVTEQLHREMEREGLLPDIDGEEEELPG
jgi:predicted transcriptional regulator